MTTTERRSYFGIQPDDEPMVDSFRVSDAQAQALEPYLSKPLKLAPGPRDDNQAERPLVASSAWCFAQGRRWSSVYGASLMKFSNSGDGRMSCSAMYFAGAHMPPIPPTVLLAAGTEVDPNSAS